MGEEASHSSEEESKSGMKARPVEYVSRKTGGIQLSDKKGSIKSGRITNKLLIESRDLFHRKAAEA